MPRLRIVSYNVHGCVGGDGLYLPSRVAAVIQEMRPDIVGLQEIGHEHGAGRAEEQVLEISRMLGMACIEGPTLVDGSGRFGNALMTALPVTDVRRLDLSVHRREPRGALDVHLDTGGAPLRVIATHLGLRAGERGRQVRELLRAVAGTADGATILLGDLNEWSPASPRLAALRRVFGRSHARPTFPARRPVLTLDRIYVRPAAMRHAVGVHRSPLARLASDHLPAWVDLFL